MITREELVKGWVARLRSGDWARTSGKLRDNDGARCAMGVLCDVAEFYGLGAWVHVPGDRGAPWHFVDNNGHDGGSMIPLGVKRVLGNMGEVRYGGDMRMVWDLSDRGQLSFSQIADLVEEEYL